MVSKGFLFGALAAILLAGCDGAMDDPSDPGNQLDTATQCNVWIERAHMPKIKPDGSTDWDEFTDPDPWVQVYAEGKWIVAQTDQDTFDSSWDEHLESQEGFPCSSELYVTLADADVWTAPEVAATWTHKISPGERRIYLSSGEGDRASEVVLNVLYLIHGRWQ